MPLWGGYWGGPWAGFGWLFPVIAFLFMGLIMFLCCRMMGRTMCRSRDGSEAAHPDTEVGELRREVQQLRAEVQQLRDRG